MLCLQAQSTQQRGGTTEHLVVAGHAEQSAVLHFGTGVADEPTIALDSAARGGMDGNSDSGRSPQMGPQGGIVADGSAWCGATSEVEDGVHRPLYFEAPATSYSPTLTGTAIVAEPVQPPDATRPDSGASGRMPSEWMELGPAPLGTMQRVLPPAWAQATEAGEAHTAMSAALAVAPAAALAVAPAAALTVAPAASLAVAPAPSLAVAPAPSLAVAPAQSAGGSGQGAHASEASAEVIRELSTYLSLKYPEREEMLADARTRLEQSQDVYRRVYNKNHHELSFAVGD